MPPRDEHAERRLASELGLSLLLARVLLRRGLGEPDLARRFLGASWEDLPDPFLLRDMEIATTRLLRAIHDRERILLYGDYDVDGTTSLIILARTIQKLGGLASCFVPHRLRDGYGMRESVIEEAARQGVRLIVSADTGIRATSVVQRASELGIDVIITDHHLPESALPPACAILNPKRPDCPYPDKDICGVGVVFKLVDALLRASGWPDSRREKYLKSLVKLVAIGTVADVVPLVGENRILVRHGLEGLRLVSNPGLRALLEVAGFQEGQQPTAAQVAFRIAPRLNAAGRMAEARDVLELFLTDDPVRARQLAQRLHQLNSERQREENRMLERILELCLERPVTHRDKVLVFSGPGWHRGVVGIVASRLVETYHRPVFVLGEDPETGLAQGSGRSIPKFHLLAALESMPDLFVQFGGHRSAAGVTLPTVRIDEFRQRLNRYAEPLISPDDMVPELEIDAVITGEELGDDSLRQLFRLAPFGYGNPEPVLALLDGQLAGRPQLVKEKHAAITVQHHARNLRLICWNGAARVASLEPGARLDVAFTVDASPASPSGWNATLRDFRLLG